VDSALLQAILENPDQFSVNIHNAEFPEARSRGCCLVTAPTAGGHHMWWPPLIVLGVVAC
jgi:hypothetical protein